jgi:hypothetical protein
MFAMGFVHMCDAIEGCLHEFPFFRVRGGSF